MILSLDIFNNTCFLIDLFSFFQNAAKEKVFGCLKNKTEMDEFCPNSYNFVTRETETTIITEVSTDKIIE